MARLSHVRGVAAERAARDALEAAGFTVIESNWRIRGAEIDHICRDDHGLAFVEVRARSQGAVEPSATVTVRKMQTLLRGARFWLSRHGQAGADWRLIVVAVDLDDTGRPVATAIIEDPFLHVPEFHDGLP